MLVSPSGLTCELATKMAVLEPKTLATLGSACLVEARKAGSLPDLCGNVRRLGQECVTHCLASKLVPDSQG